MTTTRFFRFDDAGAPSLAGVAGSFIALMKALLVGGGGGVAYGSGAGERLAAGWTVAWQDVGANKIVLRNSALLGSGCYVRIVDDGGGVGGARDASIQTFETMSDIDTGTGATGVAWIRKSNALSGADRVWIVGADERTFYITTGFDASTVPTSFSYQCLGGAGDYDPIIPGDPGIFVSGGTASVAGTPTGVVTPMIVTGSINSISGSDAAFSVSRSPTLAATVTLARIPLLNALTNADYGIGNSNMPLGANTPGTLSVHCHPAFILAAGLRGRLRGVHVPLNDFSARQIGTTVTPAAMGAAVAMWIAGGSSNASTSAVRRGVVLIERDRAW